MHALLAIRTPAKTLAGIVLGTLLLGSTALAQHSSEHLRDYLAAIDKVAEGESRLLAEMQRIQSGEVAHYDFLQFEHLELMRHARALAWPPAGLDEKARAVVETEGKIALESAMALELVIADYLRAFAQLRSAASNTLDILAQDAVPETGATRQLEHQVKDLIAAAYDSDGAALAGAFQAVLREIDEGPQKQSLQFQAQRFASSLPVLPQQRETLASSISSDSAVTIRGVVASLQ